MDDPGLWRLQRTADGSPTLVHTTLDQACHSSAGAWTEARERYAAATRLAARARSGALGAAARVLDVGTGLGLNLAAALEALCGSGVPLEVLSLEDDPRVIRRALALDPGDPELARAWAPVRIALDAALREPGRRLPLGDGGGLTLLLGDGRRTFPQHVAAHPGLRFDAVFLDPFSPAVAPALWEAPFLADVAARMAPGAWLSTYTASLRVRAALAAGGLRVGEGERVGAKSAGTLASPDQDPPRLPERTRRRLLRRLEAISPGAGGSSAPLSYYGRSQADGPPGRGLVK